MNGPAAAREIRRMGSDVYIVGVTGNLLPDDVNYFRSSGADAVLPKPLKFENLESLWIEYGIIERSRNSNAENNDAVTVVGVPSAIEHSRNPRTVRKDMEPVIDT